MISTELGHHDPEKMDPKLPSLAHEMTPLFGWVHYLVNNLHARECGPQAHTSLEKLQNET